MSDPRPNGDHTAARIAAARQLLGWLAGVRLLLPQPRREAWPAIEEDLIDVAMEHSGRMWRVALAMEVLKLGAFGARAALFPSQKSPERLYTVQVWRHGEMKVWYESTRSKGAAMFVYTLRRIMLSIPVLFAVLLITFTLGFYGPGDPLTIFLGEDFIPDEEVLQRLRKLHGLDRPFWVQFTDYMVGLVQGDFGKSLHGTKRPIIDIMRTTMPISFQLGVAASILLIVTGIPMGAIAAVKQNTWIDYIIISFSISVRSVPVFVMAPMMLIVLVLWLDLMKVPVGWDGIFSQKAIIPVFLMAVGLLLGVVRLMRQGILDTIEQNYVRTARSKGLKERMVVTRH